MVRTLTLACSLLFCAVGAAQDLRPSPPLPPLPQTFATSDYMVRVSVLAEGLSNPWSIAFLPNGDMLVTERAGRLRVIRDGVLDPEPIAGVPDVRTTILGGLLDVRLHPDFAANETLYLSYSKAMENDTSTTAIARARFDGRRLQDVEDIFVASTRSTSPTNFGGRMVFGVDGKLYMTIGERQEQDRAQDTLDHGGKVIRLNADGSVPDDNPFVGDPGYLPEIFTLGHRSPQGLAVDPVTGAIWENEHGPLGGDEINVLVAGQNYGWPLVSYGTNYDGNRITDTGLSTLSGMQSPHVYWVPSIGVSGLSFYAGEAFPLWRGNVFVGSLMQGRIRWTGHAQRLQFSEENGVAINREPILNQLRQRVRDIKPGPDGFLYVLTDQNPGVVLRVEPAE